jgi:hypothetical protein
MSLVTLHPATGDPAELTGMMQALTVLAGPGGGGAVRSGHGGLVVDEYLAHAYLTQRLAYPVSAPATPAPAPAQLAGVVRNAESAGGMERRRPDATTAPPRKSARPARVTRTEEHSHG